MKLSTVALLGAAMGFSYGGYTLYSKIGAPASGAEIVVPPASGAPLKAVPAPAADEATVAARAASSVTVDGMNGDITALKQQLVRLRADVSNLQRQVQEQGRLAATVQPDGAAPADKRPDDPEAREDAEQQRQEALRTMEADFRREPTDSRWISATTAAIQDALAGIDQIHGSLRAVECRSQTCRIELLGDRETLIHFVSGFALRIGFTLPNITANQIDHGDETLLILYLSARSDDLSDA